MPRLQMLNMVFKIKYRYGFLALCIDVTRSDREAMHCVFTDCKGRFTMVCTGHRVIRGGTTRIVSRLVLSGTEERGVVPKYGV